MSKKQKINLILLAVVLVCIIAGYFVLKNYNASKDEDSYTVAEIALEDISALDVTNSTGSFSLVKEGDALKVSADPTADTDTSVIDSMVEDLAAITANRAITDVTDFAQYGLDEPTTVITVTLTDGTQKTISLGSYSGSASRYYCRIDEETTVYMVSTNYHSHFEKTDEDLIVEAEDTEEDTEETQEADS